MTRAFDFQEIMCLQNLRDSLTNEWILFGLARLTGQVMASPKQPSTANQMRMAMHGIIMNIDQ